MSMGVSVCACATQSDGWLVRAFVRERGCVRWCMLGGDRRNMLWICVFEELLLCHRAFTVKRRKWADPGSGEAHEITLDVSDAFLVLPKVYLEVV